MNISLPEELRRFVDGRVQAGGYGSTSEYVRDLVRQDQDRLRMRSLLIDGAESPLGPRADAAFFSALRDRVPSAD